MHDLRRELSDGTTVIRAYEPGIELAVFEAARESVKEIGPIMGTWREAATHEKAAKHVVESIQALQTGTWYDFALSRAGSSVFLGRIGLDRIRGETANVGYWVRTSETGQGIATAAVQLITRFGFEDLGLRRLELLIGVDNLASRRVAEKVDATYEGVLPADLSDQGGLQSESYASP
jgi:RimJ/RimL family protein N-acetyltransferase